LETRRFQSGSIYLQIVHLEEFHFFRYRLKDSRTASALSGRKDVWSLSKLSGSEESIIMDMLLGALIGIGLAASCGLRVFTPLLVMGIASNTGHFDLGEGFNWIGSPAALVAFGVATVLEIGSRNIPYIDHLLDLIAAPSAVIAGTLVAAASVHDMSPFLTWSFGLIAGGGTAAVVNSGTALTRVVSTSTTGGGGNPALSAAESGGSIILSILSIVLPLLVFLILTGLAWITIKRVRQWRRHRADRSASASSIAVQNTKQCNGPGFVDSGLS
jgi:hypothetical protein